MGKSQFPNPFSIYTETPVPPPRLTNSSRIDTLYRDGKIYLSLDDAIMLALQNNFDIAIARYNLDIADTDLLRARSGQAYLGVNSGLVTGTIGEQYQPSGERVSGCHDRQHQFHHFDLRNHNSNCRSLRRRTRRNFCRCGRRGFWSQWNYFVYPGRGSAEYSPTRSWIRC